jgi:beta-galactosidase
MTKDYDPWQVHVRFHGALSPHVTGIDVLRGIEHLERYRLVVAPALHILTVQDASRLSAFVRGGGHLVLGPRAGVKDENNSLWRQGSPGPLADLLGAQIDIAEVLPSPIELQGELGTATSSVWAERITSTNPGLQALLRYGPADGWLDGAPGVATRRVGKGRITYVGALLDGPGLDRVMAWAAASAGLKPLFPHNPEDVEVMARDGPKGRTVVVINWGTRLRTIGLPGPMTNPISGERVAQLSLEPFGVAVLTQPALTVEN